MHAQKLQKDVIQTNKQKMFLICLLSQTFIVIPQVVLELRKKFFQGA